MCMTIEEMRSYISYACDCNGVPHIADNIGLTINNRLTAAVGRCCYSIMNRKRFNGVNPIKTVTGTRQYVVIEMSGKYLKHATEQEIIDTVVHEACHAVCVYYNTINEKKCGHGPSWVKRMHNCGVEAEVVYNGVATKALQTKRILVECTCGKQYNVTKNLITRRLNRSGTIGRCTCCHNNLNETHVKG